MVNKYKVKKVGSEYFIGREQKNSFGSVEFVLPLGRKYKYKTKKSAEKALEKFN